MKAFKAYDIRGIWGSELNADIAYRIGNFIPEVFKISRVLIGRDIRLSSDEMFMALTEGLTDAGADVYDAGLTTTPMIYWGTGKFNFEFSIMITASHNSGGYNGLKFSGKDVVPIGYDTGLSGLEKLVESNKPTTRIRKGKITTFDYSSEYLNFLRTYYNDNSELSIAFDCSNGMSALFVKDIFGRTPKYLNENMDGTFPGHEPNPLEPENQTQLKECVLKNNCDIGVIFDGDADRVMFIDENGRFVSPDLIIALLGHYFFVGNNRNSVVVQDIRSSKSIGEYLCQFGVDVEIWKVGRAFGATKLKDVDGIYGGELAGHYYFRDFYYSDCAFMAAEIVLRIVSDFKKKGITLSEMITKISPYANTGEVNFTISEKQVAMNEVLQYFSSSDEEYKLYDFDGYRLEFSNWWFNIRPSNTEPYLRFIAEAKSEELLQENTRIIYKILEKYT
jgi:phosphomannomutase